MKKTDYLSMPMPLPDDLTANAAFAPSGMQQCLDATSISAFKRCPRYYYHKIIWGWRGAAESVDLTFGIFLHKGVEEYHKDRAKGLGHEDAVRRSLRLLAELTWDSALGRPWISGDSNKNRLTLLRAIVVYLDKWKDDPLKTLLRADGSAMVEIHFLISGGIKTRDGQEIYLCGYLDRLGEMEGRVYLNDTKTTKTTLSQYWADNYTPDNQFSLYATVGEAVLGRPLAGVLLDGLQIGVNVCHTGRFILPRSAAYCKEWFKELREHWIPLMEHCAQRGFWPQNDTACGMYRGCEYRQVCSQSQDVGQGMLKRDFKRQIWDPTKER